MIPLPLSKLDRDAQAAVEGDMERAGVNRFKESEAGFSGAVCESDRRSSDERRSPFIRHVHFNAPGLKNRAGTAGAVSRYPARAAVREAAGE